MGVCCSSTANSPIYKSINELEMPSTLEAYYENQNFTSSSISSDTQNLVLTPDSEATSSDVFLLPRQIIPPVFEGAYSEIFTSAQLRPTRPSKPTRPNSFTCNLHEWNLNQSSTCDGISSSFMLL